MLKVTQSSFLDLTSHLEDVYTVKQTTPYLGVGTARNMRTSTTSKLASVEHI